MNIKGMIRGTIFSFVITFLVIFIMTLLYYFTDIKEQVIATGTYMGTVIGVFIGAFMVAKSSEKRNFLNGASIGMIYLFILLLVSVCINQKIQINQHFYIMLVGSIGAGILGGFVGI